VEARQTWQAGAGLDSVAASAASAAAEGGPYSGRTDALQRYSAQFGSTCVVGRCADGNACLSSEGVNDIFPIRVRVQRTRHHVKVGCVDFGSYRAPRNKLARDK
jgi:hypothetical protein